MEFPYYKYLIIFIITFSLNFLFFNTKEKLISEKLEQSYNIKIDTITKSFQSQINQYKIERSNVQKNDIVTIKTVFEKNGEKVVTHIIDRTIKAIKSQQDSSQIQENKTEVSNNYSDINSMTFEKKETNSLSMYNFGIIGIKPLNVMDFSNIYIQPGVRIASLPLFINIQIPINFDYRKITFGINYEF